MAEYLMVHCQVEQSHRDLRMWRLEALVKAP